MQPKEASTWFVLTLSAEQAAKDHDYEHLDALIRRREELLDEWQTRNVTFSSADQLRFQEAELRLTTTLASIQNETRSELKHLNRRKAGATTYRSAS
jgi:hypothetical protein